MSKHVHAESMTLWLVFIIQEVGDFRWCNDNSDLKWLSRGLIHLTKEAAEIHTKASLSFTAKPEQP